MNPRRLAVLLKGNVEKVVTFILLVILGAVGVNLFGRSRAGPEGDVGPGQLIPITGPALDRKLQERLGERLAAQAFYLGLLEKTPLIYYRQLVSRDPFVRIIRRKAEDVAARRKELLGEIASAFRELYPEPKYQDAYQKFIGNTYKRPIEQLDPRDLETEKTRLEECRYDMAKKIDFQKRLDALAMVGPRRKLTVTKTSKRVTPEGEVLEATVQDNTVSPPVTYVLRKGDEVPETGGFIVKEIIIGEAVILENQSGDEWRVAIGGPPRHDDEIPQLMLVGTMKRTSPEGKDIIQAWIEDRSVEPPATNPVEVGQEVPGTGYIVKEIVMNESVTLQKEGKKPLVLKLGELPEAVE